MSKFTPPKGLKNAHMQTILSSVGPRRARVRKQFAEFKEQEQSLILNCHDGIRLAGIYTQADTASSSHLAILIHGWEGGADSSYMVSLTAKLLNNGFDVFRLNLRDHGDTHHLNEGIFNSTLLPEVFSGLRDLQQRFPHQDYSLTGFSLGGNFALRTAARAFENGVQLDRVIAFCPVLNANSSNVELNSAANFIYSEYFIRKWKRSLRKKLAAFPHYDYGDDLKRMKTLEQMNQQLIPRYTDFTSIEHYFDAYAITGDVLAHTDCPCYLHFAKDDMIIPWQDVEKLADNPKLDITISEHGGHCGFLSNWRFDSWQDDRVLALLQPMLKE